MIKTKKYLGAIEIGLDPNFILSEVEKTTDFFGIVFIKKDEFKPLPHTDKVSVDNYISLSKVDKKFKKLSKELKLKNFEKGKIYYLDKQSYITHLAVLKNFIGEDSLKIIFFQKIDDSFSSFFHKYFFIYILIVVIFILLIFIIYKKIKNYQKDVEKIYIEQLEELNASENMLQNVFNTTPDIMLIANGKNTLVANKAMLDFFGYATLEDFLREHECICEFFEHGYKCLNKKIDGFMWFDYVKIHQDQAHRVSMSKDGKKHIFDVKLKRLYLNEENTHLIVLSDITDIELSRERYKFAINAINDGIWDWDLTNDNIYFSDNWKKMLGYMPNELGNTLETWKKLVHPDDIKNAMFDIQENIDSNTDYYENIHRLRHKDGHWVWILDRGKTHFNSDGKAVRMIGTHTDISDIKTLEQKLSQQTHLFDLFLENIPAAVFIKDGDGKYLYFNSLSKKTFNIDDTKEVRTEDLFDKETVKKIDYINKKTYENGKYTEVLHMPRTNYDGYYRIIEFVIKNDHTGKQLAALAFDITKEYNTSIELKHKDEIMIMQSRHAALGEMISMIAHQWRQPISIIAMEANNMLVDIELDTLDNNTSKLYANNIIYQTQELSKTIDDFRNFFKPVKIREKVMLKKIFDDVVSIIGKSFENNNIDLILNIDDTIELYTYSRELMQVLINLLKNSKESLVEHNHENPIVKVLVKEKDNKIKIEICDNGLGIDENSIEKIFEPYFTTKEKKDGTGLGLYMSRTIVEQHLKGKILVKNTEDGVCFYIDIPKISD